MGCSVGMVRSCSRAHCQLSLIWGWLGWDHLLHSCGMCWLDWLGHPCSLSSSLAQVYSQDGLRVPRMRVIGTRQAVERWLAAKSTCMVTQDCIPVPDDLAPSLTSVGTRHMEHRHTCASKGHTCEGFLFCFVLLLFCYFKVTRFL